MRESPCAVWVIVPAAGVGRRMASALPKQYAPLADRTVLEWSIAALLSCAELSGVVVALAADDTRFADLSIARHAKVRSAVGGAERAASVLNALHALAGDAHERDWVLVHDAVRPCLHSDDVRRLLTEVGDDAVGGLLAAPVIDTLKSADAEGRAANTVSREGLWRALTPQLFRFGLLRRALATAAEQNRVVTDEASAVEALGLRPKLIAGRADNIKITVPEDLSLAERILHSRMR